MILQTTEEDDDFGEEEVQKGLATDSPAWMRNIKSNCSEWLALLPPELDSLQRSEEKIKDPLFRFFDREVGIGMKLLVKVSKKKFLIKKGEGMGRRSCRN